MELPGAMPFQDYSSCFPPEELDALTAAYDAAWQHLSADRITLNRDQVPILKKEPGANNFGFRVQREAGRGAAERNCNARRVEVQPRSL
jgi:hypothetical protein